MRLYLGLLTLLNTKLSIIITLLHHLDDGVQERLRPQSLVVDLPLLSPAA